MSGDFVIRLVIALCGGSLVGISSAKKEWAQMGFAVAIVVANIFSSII